eukprot:TRINITY_DN743_c0_g1_i1.p1 TRINITY_DN743_c0_g1~~TRINITY_DN743_c0_g1_i1.p1  ORF type:complete len:237 (-),score=36.72 TRINITY_DN743_c0_g1_i1:79-753(-)
MMKYIAAVALLCVAFVYAQSPSPCCTPDQWQGYNFAWDYERDFRAGLNISYDATNSLMAIALSESHGPEHQRTYDIISNYDLKRQYIYDFRRKECYTTDLTEEFPKECIPDDAQFLASATIGATLPVDIFGFRVNETLIFATVAANCIPVEATTIIRDNGRGEPDASTSHFWDITAGIADPSVFTPNAACVTAPKPLEQAVHLAEGVLSGHHKFRMPCSFRKSH